MFTLVAAVTGMTVSVVSTLTSWGIIGSMARKQREANASMADEIRKVVGKTHTLVEQVGKLGVTTVNVIEENRLLKEDLRAQKLAAADHTERLDIISVSVGQVKQQLDQFGGDMTAIKIALGIGRSNGFPVTAPITPVQQPVPAAA